MARRTRLRLRRRLNHGLRSVLLVGLGSSVVAASGALPSFHGVPTLVHLIVAASAVLVTGLFAGRAELLSVQKKLRTNVIIRP